MKTLDKIYANQSLGLRNVWNYGYFLVIFSFFQYPVFIRTLTSQINIDMVGLDTFELGTS